MKFDLQKIIIIQSLLFACYSHGQPASYLPLDQNAPLTYTVGLGNRNEPFEGAMSVSYSHEPRRPELAKNYGNTGGRSSNNTIQTIIIKNKTELPYSIEWTNAPEQSKKLYGIIGAALLPYGITEIKIPEFYYFETIATGGFGKKPVRVSSVLKHSFPGKLFIQTSDKIIQIKVPKKKKVFFIVSQTQDGALNIKEEIK